MFLLLLGVLFGLWQVAVAYKGLNGLSLTGYPDRRWASVLLGLAVIIGSGAWYFSRPHHFASPDLEGVETLAVLVAALVVSTVLQCGLAQLAGLGRSALAREEEPAPGHMPGDETSLDAGGERVPATFVAGTGGVSVLLLHDYGGSRKDVHAIAERLFSNGHSVLSPDLDGHGDNHRGLTAAGVMDSLDVAVSFLKDRSGEGAVSAVGVGLGGTLAIEMALAGKVERAIAIDPPARDEEGFADVDSLRELRPLDVISSCLMPPARGADGRRISMSSLLADLAPTGDRDAEAPVTMIGTRHRWLNDPGALGALAGHYGPFPPICLHATHAGISSLGETLDVLSSALEQK
jgi:pimeloyl-ACP methyl ester carboxylesterase